MATGKRIKQGNTGPLWRVGVQSYDANGVAISGVFENLSVNYTCTLAVPTAAPPISRAVSALSADNTRFLAQLTPSETGTLAEGQHTAAIEVANATTTPPYKVEVHVELLVEEQLIP